MLSRGAVRSLLDRLQPQPQGWKQNPSSAMPAAANRPCLCRFSHSLAHGEGRTMLPGKMGFLHLAGGRRLAQSGALSLKGCLGWQDGGGGCGFRRRVDGEAAGIKAQVLTRQRQLMRDLEVLPLEEAAASAKTLNGNGACRRGKLLGFPEQAVAAKMVVVDVDEVLGSFLAALNKFIADRYSWNHTVPKYHVYELFRIWNCSHERANYLVHEFFTTHYFQDGAEVGRQSRKKTPNLHYSGSQNFSNSSLVILWTPSPAFYRHGEFCTRFPPFDVGTVSQSSLYLRA